MLIARLLIREQVYTENPYLYTSVLAVAIHPLEVGLFSRHGASPPIGFHGARTVPASIPTTASHSAEAVDGTDPNVLFNTLYGHNG
jgi:hypothetical protein